MKNNNQPISTTEGSQTPFQMSTLDSEDFERFQSSVPGVDRKKLHALWFKSQTFRSHWYDPDSTILKGQTVTKSEASMLFSCFAHFGFTRNEAGHLMRAWISLHPELECRARLLEEKILDAKVKEAARWKETQKSAPSTSTHTAKASEASAFEDLAKLMVISQFSYDPVTKKCSVEGVMK